MQENLVVIKRLIMQNKTNHLWLVTLKDPFIPPQLTTGWTNLANRQILNGLFITPLNVLRNTLTYLSLLSFLMIIKIKGTTEFSNVDVAN